MTVANRPDVERIRMRARMTNWDQDADVLTLCDYIDRLEAERDALAASVAEQRRASVRGAFGSSDTATVNDGRMPRITLKVHTHWGVASVWWGADVANELYPGEAPYPCPRSCRGTEPDVLLRTESPTMFLFECPGCEESHFLDTKPGAWEWDGSMTRPTVSPSILVRAKKWLDGVEYKTRCHFFMRKGNLQFLVDCTHSLAGKTVIMEAA